MTIFDTDSRQAFTSGISALALALTLAVLMFAGAVLLPKNGLTFVMIVLGLAFVGVTGWLGYHLYAIANSSYALDRNSLVIRWGAIREVVPMADVQKVIDAKDIAAQIKFRPIPILGWWYGEGLHPEIGPIGFYSTAPIEEQLIVVTHYGGYALSPYDSEAFIEAFQQRFYMGPTQLLEPARLMPNFMESEFWVNRSIQILLGGPLLIVLALAAVVLFRYPTLPIQLPYHFDATGTPDRFGTPDQLFNLIGFALLLTLLNWLIGTFVYRRGEKLGAYLAWGGSIAVQLFFLVAVMFVVFS